MLSPIPPDWPVTSVLDFLEETMICDYPSSSRHHPSPMMQLESEKDHSNHSTASASTDNINDHPSAFTDSPASPADAQEITVSKLSISALIPLMDLLRHFPDLPSFVQHPDFDHFAYCWMEYQYNILISKEVAWRSKVILWLDSMSAQLRVLVTKYMSSDPMSLSYSFPAAEGEDPEASTHHMKSAYLRLIHRLGAFRMLLGMIEHGRTVLQRSPQEVVLPLYNQLMQAKLNQQPPVSPTFSSSSSSSVSYSPTQSFLRTYPTPLSSKLASSPPSTLISPSSSSFPSSTLSPVPTTSSLRSLSCLEIMPYLSESCASSPHIDPLSLELPRQESFRHQIHQPQCHISWSTPVTPNGTSSESSPAMFWSCPVSPANHQHYHQIKSSVSHMSQKIEVDMTAMSPDMDITNCLSMTACDGDHYHQGPKDEDAAIDDDDDYHNDNNNNEDDNEEDDIYSEYQQSQEEVDDDKEEEKDSDDWSDKDYRDIKQAPARFNSKKIQKEVSSGKRRKNRSTLQVKPKRQGSSSIKSRSRQGRTATSYDAETTYYLKSLFFSIYSQRQKLTKEQRQQVVEHTGLKPRNITYWFSNHKRRFHNALLTFKQLVAEGRIHTYEEFLTWRRQNGLSDDMTDNEIEK